MAAVVVLLRYGDCVAGLLWAELGDRLGLQLPGGAPLDRAPVAPLSRPSEFSNISWMRGGMEPGISIFRVMTRSAPVAGRKKDALLVLFFFYITDRVNPPRVIPWDR